MIIATEKYFLIISLSLISFFLMSCSEKPDESSTMKKVDNSEKIINLPPTDWPVFRGDSNLTGRVSSGNATLNGKIKLLWSVSPQEKNQKTSSEVGFTGTPVINGNALFIGGSDGVLYSFSIKEGKLLWQEKTESSFEASPTLGSDLVFCGSLNGEMAAFDISNGKKKWSFKTDARIIGAANIAECANRSFIIFGSYDNNVYCLEASSGKKVWSCKSENYVNGTPAIAGDTVVFGGCDEKLRFLEISNGKDLFSIDTGSYIPGSPVIHNDKSFAALYDGDVVCIGIKEKKILWRFSGDSEKDTFLSSPAIEDRKIYVSSRGSVVYAINSDNGKQIWEFRGSSPFDASPVIFGNVIVTAATGGIISLIDKETGLLLSKYETGETFTGSPSISGNRLFIASEEGTVFAFTLY